MIDLQRINRRIVAQPVYAPQIAHVSVGMWARDIFSRSVRTATRNAQMFADVFLPPLSRRPAGKTLNALFHCGIAHNSVADLALHAAYIAVCCAVAATCVGVAFGLTQEVVQLVAFIGNFVCHTTDPDGLLYDMWNN